MGGLNNRSSVAPLRDVAGTYPGGKSGAGIYQRYINMIPPHDVFVSLFAGRCGVTRHIMPAAHTIVIDKDENVCQWWDDWRRTKTGRTLEIHHCDGIDWLRYNCGATLYPASTAAKVASDAFLRVARATHNPAARTSGTATHNSAATAAAAQFGGTAATHDSAAKYFIFGDPPYVLDTRVKLNMYVHEMSDAQHVDFVDLATRTNASRYQMLICGYPSPLYRPLKSWRIFNHMVPGRAGLRRERVWMNYCEPIDLHDYRFIGNNRRSRERIRRRQINWRSQLARMSVQERRAMLQRLNELSD